MLPQRQFRSGAPPPSPTSLSLTFSLSYHCYRGSSVVAEGTRKKRPLFIRRFFLFSSIRPHKLVPRNGRDRRSGTLRLPGSAGSFFPLVFFMFTRTAPLVGRPARVAVWGRMGIETDPCNSPRAKSVADGIPKVY